MTTDNDRCIHRCHLSPEGCTKAEALERGCACGYFCFYSPCQQECKGARDDFGGT